MRVPIQPSTANPNSMTTLSVIQRRLMAPPLRVRLGVGSPSIWSSSFVAQFATRVPDRRDQTDRVRRVGWGARKAPLEQLALVHHRRAGQHSNMGERPGGA